MSKAPGLSCTRLQGLQPPELPQMATSRASVMKSNPGFSLQRFASSRYLEALGNGPGSLHLMNQNSFLYLFL